jgi:hypothetical protein
MVEQSSGNWVIEIDEVETSFATTDEAIPFVNNLQDQQSGRAILTLDYGPVKGWKRFLGSKRNVSPCCAIEWNEPIASLIFFDDAWSEYRAIDESHPVQATDDQRHRIAHGELSPHPLEECMELTRAFAAVREYLGSRTRPNWMKYRYVP